MIFRHPDPIGVLFLRNLHNFCSDPLIYAAFYGTIYLVKIFTLPDPSGVKGRSYYGTRYNQGNVQEGL